MNDYDAAAELRDHLTLVGPPEDDEREERPDDEEYVIVHPSTGDRASARDLESARAAALQLERDYPVQTGSTRAMIFHPTKGAG